MSDSTWSDGGLTELERAAGVWGIIYGNNNGECSCGDCEECEERRNTKAAKRKHEIETSARFKGAAKLIAGLKSNRQIKLALIKKILADGLDSAIVRYMNKESLPKYYAAILKNQNCINILIEGIFYKVCKLKHNSALNKQIAELSNLLHNNSSRLTAYDRVTLMQHFIHRTVDQILGVGAAREIPVVPMRDALSAARLHLNIFDIINREPTYVFYIDKSSIIASQREYEAPRPSTAPWGKRSRSKWRVRHIRPLSHYFPLNHRILLNLIRSLDETIPADQFAYKASFTYARAS